MFSSATFSKIGISVSTTCLIVSLSIAQESTVTATSANGIQTTRFSTVNGSVSVITPSFIQSGDRISGTVIVEPKGKSGESRATNQAVLEGMVVDVCGSPVSAKKQNFSAVVPAVLAGIILLDSGGHTVSKSYMPFLPPNSIDPGVAGALPKISIPAMSWRARPLMISGNFDGDMSNTSCTIGGQDAIALAESPRQAFFGPSANLTGPQNVQVKENGIATASKTNFLALRLTVPKTTLVRGESTTIGVEVTGLNGLNANQFPIHLSLVNESPLTVQMRGGEKLQQDIRLSDRTRAGDSRITVPIKAMASGSFSVRGEILAPENQFFELGGQAWWNDDRDRPIDMNGMDTIGDLETYSIRRLMDTLRDLRQRKMWDFVQNKDSQKWLNAKIKLVKAALRQRGVTVDDKTIDDMDE